MPMLNGIKNPKTLKVSPELMQKLKEKKVEYKCRSYDEVIKLLIEADDLIVKWR